MKHTRPEMTQWVFQQILEGLCQGRSLFHIAQNIVDGISNMTAQNLGKD